MTFTIYLVNNLFIFLNFFPQEDVIKLKSNLSTGGLSLQAPYFLL